MNNSINNQHNLSKSCVLTKRAIMIILQVKTTFSSFLNFTKFGVVAFRTRGQSIGIIIQNNFSSTVDTLINSFPRFFTCCISSHNSLIAKDLVHYKFIFFQSKIFSHSITILYYNLNKKSRLYNLFPSFFA